MTTNQKDAIVEEACKLLLQIDSLPKFAKSEVCGRVDVDGLRSAVDRSKVKDDMQARGEVQTMEYPSRILVVD